MSSSRAARIEARLRSKLGAQEVSVVDESHLHEGHPGAAASGGGHFRVTVVSGCFAALGRVAAQRLVYAALDDMMGTEIHALSVRALAPRTPDAKQR